MEHLTLEKGPISQMNRSVKLFGLTLGSDLIATFFVKVCVSLFMYINNSLLCVVCFVLSARMFICWQVHGSQPLLDGRTDS